MEIDHYAITAKRFANGEAVSEHYLYGREACEMIKRRLVDQDTMERYRKAAYWARRHRYGEAAADAWEAEQKATHESSKAMLRDSETVHRNVSIPSMKAPRAYSEVEQ